LIAWPYRFLAQVSEQTDQPQTAIGAYRALLELDPPDPAEVHFRLARALHRLGDPEARRQVLQALEEAPRYREALRLLLEINGQSPRAQIRPAAAEAQR
jgi:tetratricopeptide (TPR) repeat protein